MMNPAELKNQTVSELVTTYQKTKSNDCFGELYNRYYPNLFAYCKKITHHPEDAYDITMDTFLMASEKIHSLKNTELFPSWLFRIARNSCIDRGKNLHKGRKIDIDGSFELLDDTTVEEFQIDKEALLVQMETILEQLEPDTKEILVEKYINKKTLAELQTQLGISESAVKMRLLRAKQKVTSMAS